MHCLTQLKNKLEGELMTINKLDKDVICELCHERVAIGVGALGIDVCDECYDKSEGRE